MMKWWGWGDPGFEFPVAERPQLWPWIAETLELTETRSTPPVRREEIRLPPLLRNESFTRALAARLDADRITDSEDQRLLHSYGKSYPDLFHVRKGIVRRPPDLVVFPESHLEVEAIVALAHLHRVCLIPFGGGTNIVGGVNPADADRMVVTLDMARMNRLLSLDPESNIAVIEAGALGPTLERDLQARGFSLGHYPDSFEYSTLGGWLATRSAGMQSDAYGKIEQMLVSVKLVTPAGTLTTRPAPASSAGPDLNHIVTGSEGVLGVITEAAMRVHRNPAATDYRGVLFRSFEDGLTAIHDLVQSDRSPSLVRLQDGAETELAAKMKPPTRGFARVMHAGVRRLLNVRGYQYPSIMIVGLEGDAPHVAALGKDVRRILKRHGGIDLGHAVAALWQKDKFNVPYLRDYVMDRGIMCDVAETAVTWNRVLSLYKTVCAVMNEQFRRDGSAGFIGCHVSHTYKTGACLYFTYACPQKEGAELEQYYRYKKLVTETFLANDATLTHHHAVGREHRPWMEQEVSATGVAALKALKAALDPAGIMNPAKLIPADEPLLGWAQPTPHPGETTRQSSPAGAGHSAA
jgi:alkyldihydroxyacetonephosphate synthase